MNPTLRQYGLILQRRWRWPLWGGLVALLLLAGLLVLWPPLYKTQATVFVRTPGDVSRVADGGDGYAQTRAQTYAALAGSPGLAQRVVGDLGVKLTPATLSKRVHAVHVPGTALMQIAVAAPSSAEARQTADVLVAELTSTVQSLESIPGSVVPRAELIAVDPPGATVLIAPWGARLYVVIIAALLAGIVLGALAAVGAFLRTRDVNIGEDA